MSAFKGFKNICWTPIDTNNKVIRKHRKADNIPLSENPWWNKGDSRRDGEPKRDLKTLPVVHGPIDDEWSDLLLDLTLAMAYANIMENTAIVDGVSAVSFLAFFALVWWIWASQVIYNVRFRTKDVMHRVFAFLQFIVFGMMATFSSNFNVFSGLMKDASEKLNPGNFELSNPKIGSIFASSLSRHKLPVLNARGLSMTMACSRMLLLIQYSVVLYHSSKNTKYKVYPRSVIIHMCTLLLSFIAYLVTLGVIGFNPTRGENIGKLFLWFAPMVIEILSHFYIANRVKDHVPIESEAVHKRSATLFVVILGEGLNQITGNFKYVVGAVGFTAKGAGIMFSVALIIVGELSLYSRNNWNKWIGQSRILLWFFSHYLLMAALILTLQSVRTLLSFANLQTSINTLLDLADGMYQRIGQGKWSTVTPDTFPEAQKAFADLGLSFPEFIDMVNVYIKSLKTARTKIAQTLLFVACVTFHEFDAFPEQGSALYDEVKNFVESPEIDPQNIFTVLGHLLGSRLPSAFWFWGTAGGTLVMLAILSLLKQNPADKYEFLSIVSRFIFGLIYITLSGLIVGNNKPYYSNSYIITATTEVRVSRPWKAAGSSWVIPSFAMFLVIVYIIDVVIGVLAGKHYGDANSDENSADKQPLVVDESDKEVSHEDVLPQMGYHGSV